MSWKTEITTFTKNKADKLNIYPDDEVLKLFIKQIDMDNFEKILFELGKEYAEIALQFFQSIEDYSTCRIIIEQLEEFNRTQGTQIVLES